MTGASPLRQHLRFLRRQAWLIVLVPALTLAVAAYSVSRATSIYQGEMGIIVAQAGSTFQPTLGSQALTQTMTNILESEVIAQQVIIKHHLAVSPEKFLSDLHVKVDPSSSVLRVTYKSSHKAQVVPVLKSVASAFKTLIREKLGAGGLKNPGPFLIVANVFNPPHLDPGRVSPKPVRTLVFAGLLGLALGLIFGIARESLDDRVRGPHEAEEWFGAPVLAALPRGMRGKRPPSLDGKRRRRDVVLALQFLRANFQFSRIASAGPTVLVTSAGVREEKTAVAANLALNLALSGSNVICVEADAARPTLHKYLGLELQKRGFVDLVVGRGNVEELLQEVDVRAITDSDVSPNGSGSGQPGGKLRVLQLGTSRDTQGLSSADALRKLAKTLAAATDYVIFDSAPLISAGEAYPLALIADSVLIVARQGSTTRDSAEAVRDTLRGLGAKNVAVVLTNSRGLIELARS